MFQVFVFPDRPGTVDSIIQVNHDQEQSAYSIDLNPSGE